jgi:hypothetical protein
MANRYISTRVLRPAYSAHTAHPAAEGQPSVSGVLPMNHLSQVKGLFRVAKGQEQGTRTYNQRIRRMNDMYTAMEQDQSVSQATRAFAKDMVENYMVSAYNAQRKRHTKSGAAFEYITLEQVLGKDAGVRNPVRVAEQTHVPSGTSAYTNFNSSAATPVPGTIASTSTLEQLSQQGGTSNAGKPQPSQAPDAAASSLDNVLAMPSRRPGFLGWATRRIAAVAAGVMLYASLGMQPGYTPEVLAAAQSRAVPAASAQSSPPKKSAQRPSLAKIVVSVDDNDPATPNPEYTMQNGKIRDASGKEVRVISVPVGGSIITDRTKSVFNPKPGETIDIGWRSYGPDGVRGTADDTRFRTGHTIPLSTAINPTALGFTTTATGVSGVIYCMAENPKVTASVGIPVVVVPPVPVAQAPPPVQPPANLEVTTSPPPAPPTSTFTFRRKNWRPPKLPWQFHGQPAPPPAVTPPAPPAPVAEEHAMAYINILSGTDQTAITQERVAMAPVDPHYEAKGRSFRSTAALLTRNWALTGTYERWNGTGLARLEDTTLSFSRTNTRGSADFKYSLPSAKQVRPFVLLGAEAERATIFMTNRLNFEPTSTNEFGPKAGLGIVHGAWNGTNAYLAGTTGRVWEQNTIYENGHAWGRPHFAAFGMSYTWAGAEAGIQKMFRWGMADAKASFRQNVTTPEKGFEDRRFRLGTSVAYDILHIDGMTFGLVGSAGLETRNKHYANPLFDTKWTLFPELLVGIQARVGEPRRDAGTSGASASTTETQQPAWEASIEGTVGKAWSAFSSTDSRPADVPDVSLNGMEYGVKAKLGTNRWLLTAGGTQGKRTNTVDGKKLSFDLTNVETGLNVNLLKSGILRPYARIGYSLEDGLFDVGTPTAFRKLGVTQQGWELGAGAMHGSWTGNNIYASFSVQGLQATGDSRNNLRDWGKPDVWTGHQAWKQGTLRIGAERTFGKWTLGGEGFYSRSFSTAGLEDSIRSHGVSAAISHPIVSGESWSLDAKPYFTWQSRPEPFANHWLALPSQGTTAGVSLQLKLKGHEKDGGRK